MINRFIVKIINNYFDTNRRRRRDRAHKRQYK